MQGLNVTLHGKEVFDAAGRPTPHISPTRAADGAPSAASHPRETPGPAGPGRIPPLACHWFRHTLQRAPACGATGSPRRKRAKQAGAELGGCVGHRPRAPPLAPPALPQLAGKYIFADWSKHFALPQGVLFTGTHGAAGQWTPALPEPESHPGTQIGPFVGAVGEDHEGEL